MNRLNWMACGLLLFSVTGFAQSRTWAFSKDTVREWTAYGDSVLLTNSGSDTLKIDSIGMELIHPAGSQVDLRFRSGGGYSTYHFNQGVVSKVNGPVLVFKPGQSSSLFEFNLESIIYPPVAKRSFNQGDTLVLRLIFVGRSGRGNDTLIAMGAEGSSSGIRMQVGLRQKTISSIRLFDLRGRSIDKLPEGLKAPWAPVVRQEK